MNASAAVRFWKKVIPEPNTGCWLWMGALGATGYGTFWTGDGSFVGAHRAAWELERGPVLDDRYVLHRCDVRHCVNPAHLFLGSHDENMRDMAQKFRSAIGDRNPTRRIPLLKAGVRNSSAKLDDEAVRAIRRRYAAEGPSKLAAEFGVKPDTVYEAWRGNRCRHVK